MASHTEHPVPTCGTARHRRVLGLNREVVPLSSRRWPEASVSPTNGALCTNAYIHLHTQAWCTLHQRIHSHTCMHTRTHTHRAYLQCGSLGIHTHTQGISAVWLIRHTHANMHRGVEGDWCSVALCTHTTHKKKHNTGHYLQCDRAGK